MDSLQKRITYFWSPLHLGSIYLEVFVLEEIVCLQKQFRRTLKHQFFQLFFFEGKLLVQ